MDFAEKVSAQKDLGESIENCLINFKKANKVQKSKVEYVAKQSGFGKTQWAEFCSIHAELEKFDEFAESKYAKKGYFEIVEGFYKELKKLIAKAMEDINESKIGSDNGGKAGSPSSSPKDPPPPPPKKLTTDSKEYEELVFKKQLARRMLESIQNWVDNGISDSQDTEQIKFKLDRGEKYWEEFCYLSSKLLQAEINEDEATELSEEYEIVQDIYQHTIICLERFLSECEKGELEKDREKVDLNSTLLLLAQNIQGNRNNDDSNNIRIPPIEIAEFKGDYLQWASFRDLFESLIHTNRKLKPVQKLQYLKSKIGGEAGQIIKHLQITNENYDAAWRLVNERYNNEKYLISNHVQKLFNQPQLKNEKASEIRGLLDNTSGTLFALKNLGQKIEYWDCIVVYLITQRLPPLSFKLWEQQMSEVDRQPSFGQIKDFLEKRFRTLEAIEGSQKNGVEKHRPDRFHSHERNFVRQKLFHVAAANKLQCGICNGGHSIHTCSKFNNMLPVERNMIIKNKNICGICLMGHETKTCRSNFRCFKCGGKHHTALHVQNNNNGPRNVDGKSLYNNKNENSTSSYVAKSDDSVLLATAMVKVRASDGTFQILRALIDQGSMATFVTENAAQALRLPRDKCYTHISGIGGDKGVMSKGSVKIVLTARYPTTFTLQTNAMVMNKLTSWLPQYTIGLDKLNNVNRLVLADPNFNKPGKVDMILGADVFGEIILQGVLKGYPLAQETELGWVLSGKIPAIDNKNTAVCLMVQANLDEQLKKFWEVEDEERGVENKNDKWTEEEKECEEFYAKTFKRNPDGRYEVRLPFKKNGKKLGRSKHIAVASFRQLEKRFRKQPEMKKLYVASMRELFAKDHARWATSTEQQTIKYENGEKYYDSFYFPHHPVVKETDSGIKLRVVFNASSKSCNGVSLNDILMVGPVIQKDLVDKVQRFRINQVAFTCDAEKMYLQIRVNEEDCKYQRFVWRENEEDELRDGCLVRLPFGENEAQHASVRTFLQIARDNREKYPIGAQILEDDFYVDDGSSGAHTVKKAIVARDQLIGILKEPGFRLRKWASNRPEVLEGIPEEDREGGGSLELNKDPIVKTLGIRWDCKSDEFLYKLTLPEAKDLQYTKREILSEISKLFDPLGWLAPIIITAKIFMQDLWKLSIDWDEKIPTELENKYREFRSSLVEIEKIRIPRWIHMGPGGEHYELHGFADASEKAFGAMVFLKVIDAVGNHISLLSTKSRVAPIKSISIAKLELCAADLLSKLMKKVQTALNLKNADVHCWSDSMIVLAWIQGPSYRWKTFVANKVAKIQTNYPAECWKHVKSQDNPADMISRGIMPSELVENKLWWWGPEWLKNKTALKEEAVHYETELEEKRKPILVHTTNYAGAEEILSRYSSFNKLIRIMAWCNRFVCKARKQDHETARILSAKEIDIAELIVLRMLQKMAFENELITIRKELDLGKSTSLRSLKPFIHTDGLMRVKGRLENANMTFEQKHPIILPYRGTLTTLIIREAHEKTMHGGNQMTLYYLRKKYWIVKGKQAVKNVISRCVTCHKYNNQTMKQMMSNLPAPRVNITRPFTHTGCDFAGPVQIKFSKGRGTRSYKGYICIFVCLATKAIHIEAVSDLTSRAFIAAFKRLTGRRGMVVHLYSDNGTNFVGANKIFEKEEKKMAEQLFVDLQEQLAKQKTTWHFIPPASPHFGGLWEAGVKSIKYHLKRTVGNAMLSFEELSTVLVQIEGCLNSRPLCPLSDDIDDLDVLTPGHFLVGEPIVSSVEQDYTDWNINHLTRWQLCTRLKQEFWKQWSNEYLVRLQQRPKWLTKSENLKRGDLVLIKEDRKFTGKLPMGRVLETHEGKDGLVRVVTLKVQEGILKRPIAKLALLPINEQEQVQEPEKQSSSINTRKTRSGRAYCTSTMLTVFIGMALICLAMGEDALHAFDLAENTSSVENTIFNVTSFSHQPGIYFEDKGKVNFIDHEWDIIVYYDLVSYRQEMQIITKCFQQINFLCLTQYDQPLMTLCERTLPLLKQQIQQLIDKDEFISSNQRGNRAKRFVIAGAVGMGIGYAATTAYNKFRDSQQIEDVIQMVKGNEEHVIELAKNQTSIIAGMSKIVTHNRELMSKQVEEIFSNIKGLAGQISSNNARENVFKLKQGFGEVVQHIILIIMSYRQVQDLFITALVESQEGKIHPMVLSSDTFRSQLDLIRKSLPQNRRVPRFERLSEIYSLAAIRADITDNNLIFHVKIPLVNVEDFTLFREIPVPSIGKGKMYWIKPQAEYMAFNRVTNDTYFMDDHAFQHCKLIGDSHICLQSNPIYTNGSEKAACELDLFNNEPLLNAACNIHFSPSENVWIKLYNGSWIFVCPQMIEIDIICDFKITKTNLTGSGILNIRSGCIISDGTKKLSTYRVSSSNVSEAYVPARNLVLDVSGVKFQPLILHKNKFESEEKVVDDEMEKLQSGIKELKDREVLPYDLNYHDVHHYSISFLFVIILIIIVFRKFCAHRVDHSRYL